MPNIIYRIDMNRILQFRFETGGSNFEVLEITPSKWVRWKCVAGPDQWVDTRAYFEIAQEDCETVLLFKHCVWRKETERMHRCGTFWASFLIGLKDLLDGGQGGSSDRAIIESVGSLNRPVRGALDLNNSYIAMINTRNYFLQFSNNPCN
jgi:hypothetical protein